jgi:hypothetical protein
VLVRRSIVLNLVLLCVFLLGAAGARPAFAQTQTPTAPPAPKTDEPQDPKWNLMAGYAYLYDGSWKQPLFFGYTVALTRRLSPVISLVGEGGGSYGQTDAGWSIQRYAFLGGVKLHGGEGQVRPFFQALVGYERQGGEVGLASGIAVQPGGGVDLTVNDRITLRAQGDYRWIREDGLNYSQYRISGGFVYFFGKH